MEEMVSWIKDDLITNLEGLLGAKVYPQTWVKVMENWRDSQFLIRNFGYQ